MARAKKSAVAERVSTKSRDSKIKRYRSMVLDKIRNDIEAKRAAAKFVQKVDIPDLGSMGYWKMKYWKMKYWKMGADMFGIDEVINPARGTLNQAKLNAAMKKSTK